MQAISRTLVGRSADRQQCPGRREGEGADELQDVGHAGHPRGLGSARGDVPRRHRARTLGGMHRIFSTSVSTVYALYLKKLERKGRTRSELDEVIRWLTGFDDSELRAHLAAETTFEDFFAGARLNPAAPLITGLVCGVRVEEVADPLMQKIRYLDKLVDELFKGRPMAKVLRA
jgi:hypothetical protein